MCQWKLSVTTPPPHISTPVELFNGAMQYGQYASQSKSTTQSSSQTLGEDLNHLK